MKVGFEISIVEPPPLGRKCKLHHARRKRAYEQHGSSLNSKFNSSNFLLIDYSLRFILPLDWKGSYYYYLKLLEVTLA